MDSYPYNNQKIPVGHHQGVRRFVSPSLHHTKSVSSHCGTLHKEDIRRLGSVPFSRVRRQSSSICKPSKRCSIGVDVLGRLRTGGKARVVQGGMAGRSEDGHSFKRGYPRPRWSIYQFLGWMVDRWVRIRCWVAERGLPASEILLVHSKYGTVDYLITHIFMQHAQGVPFKGVHTFLGFYN